MGTASDGTKKEEEEERRRFCGSCHSFCLLPLENTTSSTADDTGSFVYQLETWRCDACVQTDRPLARYLLPDSLFATLREAVSDLDYNLKKEDPISVWASTDVDLSDVTGCEDDCLLQSVEKGMQIMEIEIVDDDGAAEEEGNTRDNNILLRLLKPSSLIAFELLLLFRPTAFRTQSRRCPGPWRLHKLAKK